MGLGIPYDLTFFVSLQAFVMSNRLLSPTFRRCRLLVLQLGSQSHGEFQRDFCSDSAVKSTDLKLSRGQLSSLLILIDFDFEGFKS